MVIAQRLVRKLINKNEFSGRVGIFEMIKIDSEIKNYINETLDEDKIRKIAFKKYNSLLNDGEEKVKKGITSELEIKRVLKQVD